MIAGNLAAGVPDDGKMATRQWPPPYFAMLSGKNKAPFTEELGAGVICRLEATGGQYAQVGRHQPQDDVGRYAGPGPQHLA